MLYVLISLGVAKLLVTSPILCIAQDVNGCIVIVLCCVAAFVVQINVKLATAPERVVASSLPCGKCLHELG